MWDFSPWNVGLILIISNTSISSKQFLRKRRGESPSSVTIWWYCFLPSKKDGEETMERSRLLWKVRKWWQKRASQGLAPAEEAYPFSLNWAEAPNVPPTEATQRSLQPKPRCEPRWGGTGLARAALVEFEPLPPLCPYSAADKQCLGLNSYQ